MVEVTQEDREAAVTFQQNWSPFLSAGPLSALIAQTREAALLKGIRMGLDAARKWAEADAKLCDCFARSEGECACGAWCEWKTVPMHNVVEAIRALDPNTIAKDAGHE